LFGDWGLGIGPNPQSPIPNFIKFYNKKFKNFLLFKTIKIKNKKIIKIINLK
jgi:hypothetical protein